MGTPASFTQFDAFMKELYADWQVPYSAIKKSPLLAAIKHDKNAHGSHQVIPVEYGNGGGRSANFQLAQSNTQGAANAKFLVTWTNDYADAQFNGDIADFSEGEGAVVDVVTREIESKKQKLMNSLCASLYGDGSGKIGQSSTSDPVGANYITLTNKYDVTKVKVNDTIDAYAAGASAVRTGTAQVTSIDRQNGVLYFAGGVTGSITGYTPGDFICIDGDFNSKLTGLAGWLPGTALTTGSFFGVNRTADNIYLAGWTHNFSNQSISIEDCLVQAAFDVMGTDGLPDLVVMNNADWRKLELSLGQFIRYGEVSFERDGATFGFRGIQIQAGAAEMTVLPDPFCPQAEAYMLEKDCWTLKTAGDAPKILDRDGLYVRYLFNQDALECRLAVRGQLICESALSHNSHLYLPVGIGK